ncbi:hypothetical protein [Rosistilla oblonga]|uniref:hypothetical protein n=1 Tax=Rosistilla oblonga TaxID=2527990 RepID=UPI003A97869D
MAPGTSHDERTPKQRIDSLIEMLTQQKEFDQGKRRRGWDLQFLEEELEELRDEANWAEHYHGRLCEAREQGLLPDGFDF